MEVPICLTKEIRGGFCIPAHAVLLLAWVEQIRHRDIVLADSLVRHVGWKNMLLKLSVSLLLSYDTCSVERQGSWKGHVFEEHANDNCHCFVTVSRTCCA